ncbi:MAG: caspase family protein [Polyangiaceae bacterium]|nr:caspase family protein [Polyangiaceae bacterium]
MSLVTRSAAFALALGFVSAASPARADTSSTAVTLTPQLVHHFDYHANVTISPSGRVVASLHRGSIHIWDVETGTILRTLSPPGAPTFAFTNDGENIRYLYPSIVDGKGTLFSGTWDLATGKSSQKLVRAGLFVTTILAGGQRAILGENPSGIIHVYDIENDKIIKSFGLRPPTPFSPGQLDPRLVLSLSVSKNGESVLVERNDGSCELWDVDRGSKRYEVKRPHPTTRIGMAADGSRAVYTKPSAPGGGTALDVVDARAGTLLRTIPMQRDMVVGLAISADGRKAMTALATGKFRVWNLDTGSELSSISIPSMDTVPTAALSFISDDRVVFGSTGRLEIWDVTRWQKLQAFSEDKSAVNMITTAAISPAFDRAISAGFDGKTLRYSSWDLSSLGWLGYFPVSTSNATAVIAANASRAWAPSSNGFSVLDLRTQTPRNIMRDTGTFIGGFFAVSGNGKKMIVSGHRRGSDPISNQTWNEIVLSEWDAESGAKIDKLVRRKDSVSQTVLAASDDGRFVVTNDYDMLIRRKTVHLWDLTRDTLVSAFDMSRASYANATISADGKTLGIAFMEESKPGSHTVQIIDAPSGKVRLKTASSIVGLAQTMTFSPSGDKLALGSVTIEVFDTKTGALLHTFRGDTQWVKSLAFSPDGNYLLAAGQGGSVILYRFDKPASVTMISSGDEWLVYDGDGYFDASRKGGSLVAAVDGLRSHRIDQLAVRSNRPDLLLERMGLGDPDIIAHFRSRYQRRLEKLGIADESALPTFSTTPEVTLDRVDVEGSVATVKFHVVARGTELLRYNIFVNDVPLFGALGKPTSGKTQHLEERIELGSGRNKIEVSALDVRGGESLRAVRVVERKEAAKGDLYYLAFGVSKYKNSKYDLGYPHKDVTDLGDVLRAGAGHTFTNVHVRTYVNEAATVENVRKAKDFLQKSTVEDTVVLFIAGHGLHANDAAADYYFATHEVDPTRLSETAAPFDVVEDLLMGIRSRKKLFLMDTCESGEREKDEAPSSGIAAAARALVARSARQLELDVARATPSRGAPRRKIYDRERYIYNDLSRRSGAIVISSSRGSEYSYELEEIANGVFTEEILLALTTDRADDNRDGLVSTDELRAHVGRAVPERTDDQQHPTVDRDNLDAVFAFPVVTVAANVVARTDIPHGISAMAGAREEKSNVKAAPAPAPRPHACGCDMTARNGMETSIIAGIFVAALAMLRRAKKRR